MAVADSAILSYGAVAYGPGTKLGKGASVGINAILHEAVTVGDGAAIADNAVVPPKTHVPDGELWGGAPAAFIKKL